MNQLTGAVDPSPALDEAATLTQPEELEVYQANKSQNVLLPISRLPVGILQDIFLDAVGCNASPADHFKTVQALCLVCSVWYYAAIAFPQLWANVGSELTLGQLVRSLHMSKTSPLIFTFWAGHINPLEKMRALDEVIGRCHHLHLAMHHMMSEIYRLGPAHQLETCHLRVCANFGAKPVDIFRGIAPRLKELSVFGMSLLWSSPILRGLVSLKLSSVPFHLPTVREFVSFLQGMQALQLLHLSGFSLGVVEGRDNEANVHPTSLRSLEDLMFVNSDVQSVSNFMKMVHLEGWTHVKLGFGPSDMMQTSREWEDLNIDLARIFDIFHDNDEYEIEIRLARGHLEIIFLTGTDSRGRSLDLRVPDAVNLLDWLLDTYEKAFSQRVVTLSVTHGCMVNHFIDDDHSTDIVAAFTRLRHLSLVRTEAAVLLLSLWNRTLADDPGRWLVPELERITLRDCNDDRKSELRLALLCMIKGRYGSESNVGVDDPHDPLLPPAKLQALVIEGIEGMNKSTVDKIHEIVGDDVVHWIPRRIVRKTRSGVALSRPA